MLGLLIWHWENNSLKIYNTCSSKYTYFWQAAVTAQVNLRLDLDYASLKSVYIELHCTNINAMRSFYVVTGLMRTGPWL